jgi:D-glutamate cyclase
LATRDGIQHPIAAVSGLSRSRPEAQAQAKSWIEGLQASAVVAIEKAGPNAQGIYHMVGGTDITDTCSKGEAVFAEATAQGLLRIGIGDRGNELGMGPISQVTRRILPFGQDCKCPCHGGVADETAADLAVPAVISNWGAYGIVACLAAIRERPDLLHTAEMERHLLKIAISAGAIDGMSGRSRLAVDGIGLETSVGIVELLSEIYRAQSVRDPSPFSTPIITKDHKGSQSMKL